MKTRGRNNLLATCSLAERDPLGARRTYPLAERTTLTHGHTLANLKSVRCALGEVFDEGLGSGYYWEGVRRASSEVRRGLRVLILLLPYICFGDQLFEHIIMVVNRSCMLSGKRLITHNVPICVSHCRICVTHSRSQHNSE